ncbi:class I SAM-dependent methyltransferase [Marinicella gelatinilytica]|uniref:hypothetical protein n=1 Tax=Marinicella gelatinilytica TaxID=2996017 RepID=UPI002260C08E|nr:hypothetical protein [Marinicella gelatinilytica]MCX7545261.1 hypothetical protein [Marinicella gelatinilytica]
MLSKNLIDFFNGGKHRRISKWLHYFPVYETYLRPYRKKPIKMLEYGIGHGGSLQMWKWYFHKKSLIVGVDIKERCKSLEEDRIEIRIGDQGNNETHDKIHEEFGAFDIILDDGGHHMHEQIVTFEKMFPRLKEGGLYIVEDLHTSYSEKHGGGLEKPDTFIEYSKNWIDHMHGWHKRFNEGLEPNYYTEHIAGIHYFDSIVVLEKRKREKPVTQRIGPDSF